MPKLSPKRGTTGKLAYFLVRDTSSTTGAFLTALAYNTAGIKAYYHVEGAASPVKITLSAGVVGTWSSGGFSIIDATNMPLYELGVPNAAFASGKSVRVYLFGAANMFCSPAEFELTSVDNQDGVAYGLTGVPISLTEALDLTNTGDTVGGALLAARSDGFGKWDITVDGSGNPTGITQYAADGTTVVRTFTITNVAGHSVRA